MKLVYFLQTLRGAQLGYSFRLYTYGPYDGQVLEDLGITQALHGVRTREFNWPGGAGYLISEGEAAEPIVARARTEITAISDDLDWVVNEFGSRSASDLELASTIIYIDKDCEKSGETISKSDLVARVHEIKRHHDEPKILSEIHRLNEKGLLNLKLPANRTWRTSGNRH